MITDSAPIRRLSVVMLARQEAVRDTIAKLLNHVKTELPHQHDLLPDVEVVLAEILNNVVKHGHSNTSAGSADVSVTVNWAEVQIEVTDNGAPMPGLRMPDGKLRCPSPAEAPLADLPEGGFGWALIRMLAKQVSYQRVADQNKLTVVIPVIED